LKKKIYKNIFYNLLTKFFLIFIKFGITIFTSRFLGAEGRGIFVLVNQIVGIANTFISISCGEGLIYYLNKSQNYKKKIFFITIFLILVFSLISSIILISLNILFSNEIIDIKYKIIVLALVVPVMTEYFLYSVLKGLKLFSNYNKISILTRTILFLLICSSILVKGDVTLNCLIFYTIGYFLNLIIYFVYFFKITVKKLYYKSKDLYKVIKYSSKIHLINFITELEYKIDNFIIVFFLDLKAVGIYSIAVTITQLVFYVTNSINNIVFPYVSSNLKIIKKDEVILDMVTLSFTSAIIILFPLVLAGFYIFPFIFGAEFLESYYIFLILAFGILAESISRVIITWFKGLNKTKELLNISVSCIILNIILNLYLIPILGLKGAAISSVVTYTLRMILILVRFRSYVKFKISKIFKIEFKQLYFFISSIKNIT
tara:strand:+ start:78 stop:1370 length:1293 start_codon:yes stop_codon:yes gene_type:complete